MRLPRLNAAPRARFVLMFLLLGALGARAGIVLGSSGTEARGTGEGRITLAPGTISKGDTPVDRALGPNAIVLSEGFEGAWPSAGWQVFDDTGLANGEYYWANRCTGRTGGRSAWAPGGGVHGASLNCSGNYPNNMESWAIYGPVDLSQASAASLTFHFWMNSECVGANCQTKSDRLNVAASADGTNFDGPWWAGDWYADPGAVNGWNAGSMDLADYVGNPRVWIAFMFASDSSVTFPGGAYIDDVVLDVT
jgi:hypothetical protein